MKKTLKTAKILTTLFASTLMLQGCVAALIGGGAAATKVATDPRTAGTQVDDNTLEIKVRYNISKDPQIDDEARVEAISYSGRVLLIGQVPNESLKSVAESLARGTEGVDNVYNEIRTGTPIDFKTRSKDTWITTQIKSKLFIENSVKATDVKVITENAEVFLLGNLTSTQADAAAEVARNISGVRKVIKVVKHLD